MRLRQRIRIHLDTGRTIDGVLMRRRRNVLELADASVEIDGKLVPVDECVLVPRARIEFAQRGVVS